jgi:putative hydrolase of the HAD superfamily
MPNPKSLKSTLTEKHAVIFDLFHTLTSIESAGPPLPGTTSLLGIDPEKWNQQLWERSEERLTGKIKDPFLIMRQMVHAIDPGIKEERIDAATEIRLARFRGTLANIPASTRQTLLKLKERGKKIGLLSNADALDISGWSNSPIAPLFDSVVFSCEVGFMKPQRKIYEISLKQLSLSPQEVAFVGDGGSHELEAAKELGITTVFMAGLIRDLWPDKIEPRKKLADFAIENLDELVL